MSKKDYKLISPNNLEEIFDYIDSIDHDIISFDLETDHKQEHLATNIGIGISGYPNEGRYIPIWKWVNKLELEKLKGTDEYDKRIRDDGTGALIRVLSEKQEKELVKDLSDIFLKRKLIGHNLVYDVAVWEWNYQINLTDAVYADTILMKHTIDEERPFGLKDIAIKYQSELGIPDTEVANQEQLELAESVKANGGKWTKHNKDIYKGGMEIIGRYCCMDTDLVFRLFEYFEEVLEEQESLDFFYDWEVMPLYRKATIPMKLGGLYIDVNYFKNLKKEVESGIIDLTDEVFSNILEDVQPFVEEQLDKHVASSRKGKFAKKLLDYYSLEVPKTASGKPSLAKKNIQRLEALYPDHIALKWLSYEPITACPILYSEVPVEDENGNVVDYEQVLEQTKPERVYEIDPEEPLLPREIYYEIKKGIYTESNPDLPHVFNLASKEHLSWLLFNCYGLEPKDYSRKTKKPKVDKDSLKLYVNDHPFIEKLMTLFKEEKLLSTYIKPILEYEQDGWLYPSMLQFGTTSGRYSCGGGSINFQTLPRDDTRVKKGFIAPPGYKIVNADFSSLEPRIFSWVSGDEGLKQVYRNGLDLYSQIAIDVFGLEGVSAREEDDNFLKKVNPQARQDSKVFTLAVPYGANAYRISQLMGVEYKEADKIIRRYLDAYPDLKDYMENQKLDAIELGYVQTSFGRIRHLPEAKELYDRYGKVIFKKKAMQELLGDDDGSAIYYKFRNLINNSRNSPIQATAAHVTNAAMIKLADTMAENNIDGWICLQIHDEICTIVREEQAELQVDLLRNAMENNEITQMIDIPILAEPCIADSLAEAK